MNNFLDQLFWNNVPLLVLLFSLMAQSILICIYAALIYAALRGIKAALSKQLSVRANYFSWYLLLLSLPLAGAHWNDPMKAAFYGCLTSGIRWRNLAMVLAFAWLAAVMMQLAAQIALTQKINRAIKHLPVFYDAERLQSKAAETVGLGAKRVQVLIADFVTSPVSYGVFTKSILLPDDYESRYCARELYTLLLHEMIHIKNNDTVKAFFISLAECFLWVLRPLNKLFRRDTELLCDNRVMGLDASGRSAYGDLLLKECSHSGRVRGIAFSDSYHTLQYRLDGLFRYQPEPHKGALLPMATALLLLLALIYSYWRPAEWLVLEEGYNAQFEIFIEHYDPLHDETVWTRAAELLTAPQASASGELVEVSTTALEQSPKHTQLQQAYEVSGGQLIIDAQAMQEALRPIETQEIPINRVAFRSPNFIIDTCAAPIALLQGQWISTKEYTLDMAALADSEAKEGACSVPLERRGAKENLYLLIARWF